MIQEKDIPAHVYTVELRFSGDQLEPIEISSQLNLKASSTWAKSQNQSIARSRRPYWAYNGKEEDGFQSEWGSLEDGLAFLIKSLRSKKSEVIALTSLYDGIWWCGHFQSSFSGGPTFSAELLSEVSSYGMPLSIDNYFNDD